MAWSIGKDEALVRHGQHADGTIVGVEPARIPDDEPSWVPRIEFRDKRGEVHSATGNPRRPKPVIGAHLEVYYGLDNSDEMLVSGDERVWEQFTGHLLALALLAAFFGWAWVGSVRQTLEGRRKSSRIKT
jgi:hypothetical protein